MTLTIEQRWKDVGVDRQEVKKAVWGNSLDDAWRIARRTDALLPLIEKAVRKAKLSEALLWATRMSCGEEGDKRIAELEAGE